MKKTIRKVFFVWEYDKEEKWLNEMSSIGWQLVKASVLTYTFETGSAGEYTYRLELLDKNLKSLESTSYLNFLQETGIEMVGKCRNWIYLRCKTTEGGFEPNNKTLYDLSHLLKIQDFLNTIRNRTILMIAIAISSLLILEFQDASRIVDFFKGFCTGLVLGGSIGSLAYIPFSKRINEKVKKNIKELYTCE
jgi:hypothetical protein